MKSNDKLLLGIGVAAGAAAALIPAVIGFGKADGAPSRFDESSLLSIKDGGFVTGSGESFIFRLMMPDNMTPEVSLRERFNARFGSYGAAQLVSQYEQAYLKPADLDNIRSLGFNSVLLTFGLTMLFSNGKISKTPDFSRLNSLVDSCAERGLRVVLQLNDAALFTKKDKPQNNLVTLWKLIAAEFTGSTAVAAFKLSFDNTKLLKKAAKAVKKADPARIIILNESESGLARKLGGCALLVNGTGLKSADLPCIMLTDKAENAVMTAERGRSCAFSAYKNEAGKPSILEEMTLTADPSTDSYDELLTKYFSDAATESCRRNEDICSVFTSSTAFSPDDEGDGSAKKGFSFSAGIRSGKKLTVISR